MAKVAVIGAGLGGLSAAIHLAARGHEAVVFERTEAPGGKAGRHETRGYTFDTGPSLVTMPEVLDELFAVAGADRREALPLTRLDPQCRYFFDDGTRFDLADDRARAVSAIEAFAPGEGQRFERTLDFAKKLYDASGAAYLDHPYEGFPSFGRRLGTKGLAMLPALRAGSLENASETLLRDERLRWLLQRFATYSGGGPRRSPAALAMVLHVEHAGGAYYPNGGISAIPEALTALARSRKVAFRFSQGVERLVVNGRRVTGLETSRTEHFDAVIANADPVTVATRLLSPEESTRAGLAELARAELGMSGVVLMLGVRGRLPQLAHHNVLFPSRYEDEFTDVFEKQQAPEEPTVYLCVPSRTDATRAPEGCESVFCMINAPATSGRDDWKSRREQLAERIKTRIERLVPDLRSRIEVEELIDPDHFAGRYLAPGGSIYGVTPHGRLSPFHRPLARVDRLPGLYFAGGGTHPGGGIPLVLRSGRFAVDLLEADLAAGRLTTRKGSP